MSEQTDTDYLVIEFPNGDVYAVKASHIAEERAIYYADSDHGRDADKDAWKETYHEEREYALNNPREILDWAANNMDWEDVRPFAQLLPSEGREPAEMWTEADLEVRPVDTETNDNGGEDR